VYYAVIRTQTTAKTTSQRQADTHADGP